MSSTNEAVDPVLVAGWPYARVKTLITGESMAHQSFAEESDINRIIKGFRQTGWVDHQTVNRLVYGDFRHTKDLTLAYQQVAEAEAIFDALPARVRDAAENDPAKFIDLVAGGEHDEMLRELGLKNPIVEDQRPPPAALPVEVVPPPVVETPPASAVQGGD